MFDWAVNTHLGHPFALSNNWTFKNRLLRKQLRHNCSTKTVAKLDYVIFYVYTNNVLNIAKRSKIQKPVLSMLFAFRFQTIFAMPICITFDIT